MLVASRCGGAFREIEALARLVGWEATLKELARRMRCSRCGKKETRQRQIEDASVRIRGALKRNGRLPRYVLSGLLYCEQCGGTMRNVNAREYGALCISD